MKEALSQTLTQRLQQRLSPLQMRLVRMLEMSEPEMEDEVRRELDDNPALVTADSDNATEQFAETAEEMQMADYQSEDDIPFYRLDTRNHSADDTYYEPVAVAGDGSMMDMLMAQIAETDIPEEDMPIAAYIIGNLDDNGYMTRTLPQIEDDLAINAGIDVTSDRLRSIFDRVRALDPAGVGAMDLRDCLLLQLRRRHQDADTELATEIVSHYFDLFSLRHFDRLESMLGVSRDSLRRAEEVIKSLDPKPAGKMGENADDDRTRHIVPDFIVETAPGNVITVTMPNNIPDLVIESSFRADAGMSHDTSTASSRRRDALTFINRKREEASDFIDLLKLRRRTLMRVMEAIVNIQRKFFLTEDESTLRPMVLKDIAALTGFDISVISRATAGKYVATAGGIYPLKFFFNEGIRAEGDEEASTRAILAAIRTLVEAEDPSTPLSDEAILARLKEQGYELARRTVAKYRDRLGIPVARLRKKI